ncbi:hypothetical protein [Microbaculum sp. FT89]|uniref:hypothetical protein n=1 Tax=Microbaculum sp. FT89 TaxID=3447298 RepID=UPI003F53CA71
MASVHTPLRVWDSALSTYHSALMIAEKYGEVLLVAVAVSAGLSFLVTLGSIASLVGFVGQGLVAVVLALLAHHEIIRGEAHFDESLFGGNGEKVGIYFAEVAFLFVCFRVGAGLLVANVIGPIVRSYTAVPQVYSTAVIAFLVILLFPPAARFALRMPSRALDQTLSWGQAWRLGAGNTLALAGGLFLAIFPLMAVATVVSNYVFPDDRLAKAVLFGLALPPTALLGAVFLSIAFVHCGAEHRDIVDNPLAQNPPPPPGGKGLGWFVVGSLVPAFASVVIVNSKIFLTGYMLWTGEIPMVPDPDTTDFFGLAGRLPPKGYSGNAPFPDRFADLTTNLEIATVAALAVWALILVYVTFRYRLRALWMVVGVPFVAYSTIMLSRGI